MLKPLGLAVAVFDLFLSQHTSHMRWASTQGLPQTSRTDWQSLNRKSPSDPPLGTASASMGWFARSRGDQYRRNLLSLTKRPDTDASLRSVS